MRRRYVGSFATLAYLMLASVALAENGSSVSGYGGVAGKAQSGVSQGGSGLGATGGGALPFTGLDLVLLVAGAAVLLLVGLTLRRVARARA